MVDDAKCQPTSLGDITTPRSKPGLLTSRHVLALAARLGAWLASFSARPLRIGKTVIVARHADVRQLLERDLDFRIAPINAGRIEEVNGPFILGMDRGGVLNAERTLLYQALHQVDFDALRDRVAEAAMLQISAANNGQIDVIGAYARPVAAMTAEKLFGVTGADPVMLMEVARAVFAHTFLNLSNDETVRQRALKAGKILSGWISQEIKNRVDQTSAGDDLMGQLIRLQGDQVDTDVVRRTLGGMLVGSIDTTATCVAKIIAVLADDAALFSKVARDVDNPDLLRGWCWEALRRWPHNPILLRQAAHETVLNGREIKAGDRVVAWTQAAMLDATAFPDPARMRPDRSASSYLHFGGALHACAGRSVNGFQIPILVGTLVRHGIGVVKPIEWAGPFPDKLMVALAQ